MMSYLADRRRPIERDDQERPQYAPTARPQCAGVSRIFQRGAAARFHARGSLFWVDTIFMGNDNMFP